MQEISNEREQLINEAKKDIFEKITSTRRSTREKVVRCLTSLLDVNSEGDKALFQLIPLEILERGDVIAAIWYIETIGKIGNSVSLEVFEQVIEAAIDVRMDQEELQDTESVKALDSSIDSLFRMVKKHHELKEESKLSLLMGSFEEARGMPYNAISHYNSAIEKSDIDGYLAAAMLYDGELKQEEMAVTILDIGYTLHEDIRLLGSYIHLLCRIGKLAEAQEKYEELKLLEKNPLPFIVYKSRVDNDDDLQETESVIANYFQTAEFVPSEPLAILSKSATNYIGEQVNIENEKLLALNAVAIDNWSEENHIEYQRIIFRRLKLLQLDILTLCNHRYLEYYLRDIEQFGFGGSIERRSLLETFFMENFSQEVKREMDNDSPVLATGKTISKEDEEELVLPKSDHPNSIFEDISLHVSRVGELFCQPGFYDLEKEQISPLLAISARYEGELDDEMEENIAMALQGLKDNADFYYSLNPSIVTNYENFLMEMDEKYGVFYRRHIQMLAMNGEIDPEKYPKILREYSDIALLFWTEKLISGQFPTDDPEKIDKLIQLYDLDHVSILNALVFGAMLLQTSPEYAIVYLADYPNMLDVPMALYIITEGLRTMDSKNRNMAIKDLHKIAKERYDARGFFDHVRFTFADIYKSDPSDSDITEMLLTSGNLVILQKKKRTQAILNFHTAGEEFGSLEGLLQAGDSCENMGEYDRALQYFEQALLQDDSILVVTKILNCTICSYKFDTAEKYIQYGLAKGYSINNYVLALHLWRGESVPAFLQMIEMIKQKQNVINMPEGLPRLLYATLKDVMIAPDLPDRYSQLSKVYGSFILSNISPNGLPVNLDNGIHHWGQIDSLTDIYAGERLHEIIEDAVSPITGKLESTAKKILAPSDQSVEYLNAHGINLYNMYSKILSSEKDPNRISTIRDHMSELSGRIIMTLNKFPDSEKYIKKWRSAMTIDGTPNNVNTILHDMPETIQ